MELRSILLEWESIVLDTAELRTEALQLAFSQFGIPAAESTTSFESPRESFSESIDELCLLIAPETDDTIRELLAIEARRQFTTILGRGINVFPGAVEAIVSLASVAPVGIVTRADRSSTDLVLSLTGLENIVRCSLTSTERGDRAISADNFLQADRRTAFRGAEGTRSAALVSTEAARGGASSAGFFTIAVGGWEAEAPKADYHVSAVPELTPALLLTLIAQPR